MRSAVTKVEVAGNNLTCFLTSWKRALLQKLTGSQLVENFPAFYGNRRLFGFICPGVFIAVPPLLAFNPLQVKQDGLKLNGAISFWFMLMMLIYWVEVYIL
jgi:hypothetical protein